MCEGAYNLRFSLAACPSVNISSNCTINCVLNWYFVVCLLAGGKIFGWVPAVQADHNR